MKKQIGVYAVLLLSGLLAACQTSKPISRDSIEGLAGSHTKTQMNSVRVLDSALISHSEKKVFGRQVTKTRTKIVVEKHGATMTPTGLKEVIVTTRNQTDYPLQLEGRVTWFDAAEIPREDASGWQRIYIDQNSSRTFRQNATDPRSMFYMVDIREAR